MRVILGLYRDSGEENGNYYVGFKGLGFKGLGFGDTHWGNMRVILRGYIGLI